MDVLMKHLAFLLSLIFIFTAFTGGRVVWGASENARHVAVLQFRPSGTSSAHAVLAGNYVEMELLQKKEIVLLERGQVKKKYTVEEANRYSCRDSSCAVLAGRELSADYVVIGDVVRNGRFSIKVRVISVLSGKIVFSCSARYDSENGARSAAAVIAKKIIAGFRDLNHAPASILDQADKGNARPLNIDFYAGPGLLKPLGMLDGLIGPGSGFNSGVMISGIPEKVPELLRRIIAGFDTGVFYSRGKINPDDYGLIAPFSFSLGYLIPVTERIYFIPLFSGGFTYLRFRHAEGDGLDMEDNSSVWSVDPHSRVMLIFGRPLMKNIHIEFSTGFWILVESPRTPFFITAQLGLACHFEMR